MLKVFQWYFTFFYYLLLEKGVTLPFLKDSKTLCANFGWNWPCVSEDKDENIKKNKTTKTTTTDKRWIFIRKAHFSLWIRWANDEIIGILPWSLIYHLFISELDDVYLYFNHIIMVKLPSRSNCRYISYGRNQLSYLYTFTIEFPKHEILWISPLSFALNSSQSLSGCLFFHKTCNNYLNF